MSFSAEWLALREPVDHAARNTSILATVSEYFSEVDKIKITDIGSGTGSTVRALKPALGQRIEWHLIDNDGALISVAKKHAKEDSVSLTLADLSKQLDPLFATSADLITTSAFLDLVSRQWLARLVQEVSERNLPFYAAITYDGRAGCSPELEFDRTVIDLFNRHQKTDKGFGPALGPDAANTVIKLFRDNGYKVHVGRSDWQGTPDHKAFQKTLLEGWAVAAEEIAPEKSGEITSWLQERFSLIEENKASLFVGHKDIFAIPA